MIGPADINMMPQLRQMWMRCFGDSQMYTDYLFEGLIKPQNLLVYTFDSVPAAMLCLQPFALQTPLGNAQGAYIFGVATLPEHQGRGLSTALMEHAHAHLAQNGYALSALVPAAESLFAFYARLGYETAFFIEKRMLAARDIAKQSDCALTPVELATLDDMRGEYFGGRKLFVRWDRSFLQYVGDECRFLGGEVLAVSCNGSDGYAVCYPYKGTVVIKELAIAEEMFGSVMAAIHQRYQGERYVVYLTADFSAAAVKNCLPFAMVKWYDIEKGLTLKSMPSRSAYIGHVLD